MKVRLTTKKEWVMLISKKMSFALTITVIKKKTEKEIVNRTVLLITGCKSRMSGLKGN